MRVLKKGGEFALQDLFYIERMFGKAEDLLDTIKSWGVREVEFVVKELIVHSCGAKAFIYGRYTRTHQGKEVEKMKRK